jgi:hypothetical protein
MRNEAGFLLNAWSAPAVVPAGALALVCLYCMLKLPLRPSLGSDIVLA